MCQINSAMSSGTYLSRLPVSTLLTGRNLSYPFHYIPFATKPIRDEFSSHENPSDGQLVLGHASPLTAFLLSQDEKYIITADRDEHIRVSWYPEGYNIEMYCLGHRKCAFPTSLFSIPLSNTIPNTDMFQRYMSLHLHLIHSFLVVVIQV